MEDHETPEECIRREVLEELNCSIQDIKLFHVYVVNNRDKHVLIVYTGRINGQIRLNSEIEQIRWIDKSEINEFEFYGNEREKLMDYFSC